MKADIYIIADIMDTSITKTTVEFVNVNHFDFLYTPTYRIAFPTENQ